MKYDIIYDAIEWSWKNIPVLKSFDQQTQAIITYLAFNFALVILVLEVLTHRS